MQHPAEFEIRVVYNVYKKKLPLHATPVRGWQTDYKLNWISTHAYAAPCFDFGQIWFREPFLFDFRD